MEAIPKISNTGLHLHSQVPFKERHRKRPLLDSMSKMTNEEIITTSFHDANKKTKNSKAARALKSGPFKFLAAVSIAKGVVEHGNLSSKLKVTGKTAAKTALYLGLAIPAFKVADSVVDKFTSNKKDDSKKKDNRVLKTVLGAGLLMGAVAGVIHGAKKGSGQIKKAFPNAIETVKSALNVEGKKNWLDNVSILGRATKKASQSVDSFVKRHPDIADFTKKAAVVLPATAVISGTLVKADKVVEKRDKIAVSNIKKLVTAREFAKEVTEIQDETVAQNS